MQIPRRNRRLTTPSKAPGILPWAAFWGEPASWAPPTCPTDARKKTSIAWARYSLPTSESGERKQLPIYQYSYKKDPASVRHIGPMAQDVEKIVPEGVDEHEGVKYIKPQHVMGSILRAG